MADRPRFGPAGVPLAFKDLSASISDVPKFLRAEDLDAFEYQAVHWGPKPQMRQEEAEKLGTEAEANDVWLSLHGSYFVNFCGSKEIVEASKRRLIACATAAQWMGAHVVVFHPGFPGTGFRMECFRRCVKALSEVASVMRNLGIERVKLGPETMGKRSQLGSLSEILGLCEKVEQTQLVIDWSHLHARDRGRFRSVEDFIRIILETEKRLGSEAVKNMHCHFTKIEFTEKGERRHHVLDEKGYGPDFASLAKVIAEFRLRPVVICESPLLDLDAMKMRDILQETLKTQPTLKRSSNMAFYGSILP